MFSSPTVFKAQLEEHFPGSLTKGKTFYFGANRHLSPQKPTCLEGKTGTWASKYRCTVARQWFAVGVCDSFTQWKCTPPPNWRTCIFAGADSTTWEEFFVVLGTSVWSVWSLELAIISLAGSSSCSGCSDLIEPHQPIFQEAVFQTWPFLANLVHLVHVIW